MTRPRNSVATAPGSDAHDGLSPANPKRSLQAVLDDAAHPLNPGDVILVDAGTYRDSAFFTATANGVLVLGSPHEPAVNNGLLLVSNSANLTFDHLTLATGLLSTADTNLTITDNIVQGIGIMLRGGTAAQVVHNLETPGTYGVTLSASVQNPVIEHNTIRAGCGRRARDGNRRQRPGRPR